MPDGHETALSPEQAVDRLEALHAEAVRAQRDALARFAAGGAPPDPAERRHFRYPELRLVWAPSGPMPVTRRAWAKFQTPGIYATTVTQPGFFRRYLLEQLRPLVAEYGAAIEVGVSDQEMPYPYVLERGDELAHAAPRRPSWRDISPTPLAVGGRRRGRRRTVDVRGGQSRGRWRCSMRCGSITRCAGCVHYTGTDWRSVQPWILLTNYQRYVDQFVRWGLDELAQPRRPVRSSDRCRAAPWSSAATTRSRPRRGSPPRPGIASRCPPIT